MCFFSETDLDILCKKKKSERDETGKELGVSNGDGDGDTEKETNSD